MNPFVMKGILVGSSLGVFAAIFGLVDNMARAFVLGGLVGLFAGLTMSRIRKNKPPVD